MKAIFQKILGFGISHRWMRWCYQLLLTGLAGIFLLILALGTNILLNSSPGYIQWKHQLKFNNPWLRNIVKILWVQDAIKNYRLQNIFSLHSPYSEEKLETKEEIEVFFAKQIPNYHHLKRLEKAFAIREWFSRNIDEAAVGSKYYFETNLKWYQSKNLIERIDLYLENVGGVVCGGNAHLLAQVYSVLGYDVYMYDYGTDPFPFTHSVVLVGWNGKFYIQDSFSHRSYWREDGTPMPLGEIIEALKNRNHHKIIIKEDFPIRQIHTYSSVNSNYVKNCQKLSAGHYLCEVHYASLGETEYFLWQKTAIKKYLQQKGVPPHRVYTLLEGNFIRKYKQGQWQYDHREHLASEYLVILELKDFIEQRRRNGENWEFPQDTDIPLKNANLTSRHPSYQ